MKIICDNCGAKYSIADEKVRGKTFKIRCKKCQHSIVVRGDKQPEAAPAAAPAAAAPAAQQGGDAETKVFDYAGYKTEDGDTPVWYVAVDGGEQQGPYATSQMREFLAAGNITSASFVWKEGFEDWKTAGEVPDIAAQAVQPTAGVAAPPVDQQASADTGGGLFDSPPASDDGGGLFDSAPTADPSDAGGGLFDSPLAGDAASSGGGLFDSAPEATTGGLFSAEQDASATIGEGGGLFDGPNATGGGDLFDESASGEEGGGIFASTEAPAAGGESADAAMTGQRNENSVLFSLSNLQALASDDTENAPSAAAGNNVAGPGMATNEASGLIDIRKMASSLSAEAEKADDVDEMLSLGIGGGFAGSAGAPVLKAAEPQGLSMGVKIGIVVGFLLLVGVVVGAVVMFSGKDDAASQEIALLRKQLEEMRNSNASADEIAKKMAELDNLKKSSDDASGSVQQMPDKSVEKTDDDDEDKDKDDKSSKSASRSGSSRRSASSASDEKNQASSSSQTDDKAASSAKTEKKSTAKTAKLDALLGGGGSQKKAAPKPASSGDKLTRQQVISGMNAVASSVQRCGAGKSGKFSIRARIGTDGRVEAAQAVGAFKGTPEGTCAARAVRRAKFPRSSSTTNVTYPFKI